MRRFKGYIAVISLILSINIFFAQSIFATSDYLDSIKFSENSFINAWFKSSNIIGEPSTYLLKDLSGEYNYILAETNNTYMIMRRKTFTIVEHANGREANPYNAYLNNEIFYAGPMSYLVKTEDVIMTSI